MDSTKITKDKIERAKSRDEDVWTLGYETLVQLCECYPEHTDPKAIVAKMWLIGRAYSAAVERRKNNTMENQVPNDRFYKEKVTRAMRSSELDETMSQLRQFQRVDSTSIIPILEVHNYLVKVLSDITGHNKRSLASKYLHFHMPNLFYIYDSRANRNVRSLKPINNEKKVGDFDYQYAKFAYGLLELQELIEQRFGDELTPYQLDRLLLNL